MRAHTSFRAAVVKVIRVDLQQFGFERQVMAELCDGLVGRGQFSIDGHQSIFKSLIARQQSLAYPSCQFQVLLLLRG